MTTPNTQGAVLPEQTPQKSEQQQVQAPLSELLPPVHFPEDALRSAVLDKLSSRLCFDWRSRLPMYSVPQTAETAIEDLLAWTGGDRHVWLDKLRARSRGLSVLWGTACTVDVVVTAWARLVIEAAFNDGLPQEPASTPSGAERGTCQGCGTRVLWVVEASGRKMPLNDIPRLVRLDNGRWANGWESHWSTCPVADRYRGRGRGK